MVLIMKRMFLLFALMGILLTGSIGPNYYHELKVDGSSEITVQNYDNNLWQLNQWNLVSLELKATDYTFSTESYILIDMVVKNSHFIDDIYVNVTSTETVVDWTNFGIDIDGSDGWNWEFTFPNNNGFYEFFSIGYLAGSRESDPVQFDAKCMYGPGGP